MHLHANRLGEKYTHATEVRAMVNNARPQLLHDAARQQPDSDDDDDMGEQVGRVRI
jgi:hypothetical protein